MVDVAGGAPVVVFNAMFEDEMAVEFVPCGQYRVADVARQLTGFPNVFPLDFVGVRCHEGFMPSDLVDEFEGVGERTQTPFWFRCGLLWYGHFEHKLVDVVLDLVHLLNALR
jgi:hypothetical protein